MVSNPAKYEHFIDELMEYEVEYTYRYMDSIGCESIRSGLVTEDFIHMIGTAYSKIGRAHV